VTDGVRCYVAIGDSFTAGIDPSQSRWADEVAKALGPEVRYENIATIGATSEDVERDQLERCIGFGPDVVSLVCGANDVLLSTRPDPEAYHERLGRMFGRLRAEVPGATVVVMNPTHYAVALKYDQEAMGAPRVVAKGTDRLAMRIRDLARDAGVPVLEAPPLAINACHCNDCRKLTGAANLREPDGSIPSATAAFATDVDRCATAARSAASGSRSASGTGKELCRGCRLPDPLPRALRLHPRSGRRLRPHPIGARHDCPDVSRIRRNVYLHFAIHCPRDFADRLCAIIRIQGLHVELNCHLGLLSHPYRKPWAVALALTQIIAVASGREKSRVDQSWCRAVRDRAPAASRRR